MRLIAYRTSENPLPLRPAGTRRGWMDESTNRYVYRCLPLTIANTHGWELLSPCTFDALWTGGHGLDAVQLVRLGGPGRLPDSHFGEGVFTFHPGFLFRTDDEYDLYVGGPANTPKDGVAALTGIVETDWAPFTFTMNWRFTRVGVPVRFEEGEPICQFFPLPKSLVESVEPEVRDIASEPRLEATYEEWKHSRDAFNAELRVPNSPAEAEGWQRYYSRGTLPDGTPAASRHRTRLNVKPFARACPVEDAVEHAVGRTGAASPDAAPETRETPSRPRADAGAVRPVP